MPRFAQWGNSMDIIGDLITFHRSVANYAHMYATILSIVLFAVVAVGLLQRLETLIFRPEMRSAA